MEIPIIAFANADGGTVAIGISDKTRRIEGVDYDIQKLIEGNVFRTMIPLTAVSSGKVGLSHNNLVID